MPDDTTIGNPLDLWRQFLTDSERQWNGFFKDVLGTDTFSNAMNAWVETSLTVQRMVADNLERYYTEIGRASCRERVWSAVAAGSSRRRHTRCLSDWSSDVCSSDLTRQSETRWTCGGSFSLTLSASGTASSRTCLARIRSRTR